MHAHYIRSVLVALLLSTGCGKDSGTAASSKSAEVAGAKPAAEAEQPAKEDAEEAAAGLVVRTYNEVLGNVERSLVNPYLTQVGEQLPPVEKMQHVTLGSLGGPWDRMLDEAKQALGEARAAAPQLPLIAEADALLARTRELGEAYRAVAQYFSAGTYKTDKGAGAGPVHDKLIQALDAYAEAQGKVAMALELREQEMLRREMAAHAPTSVSHQYRKALLAAKVLLSARRLDAAGFAAANEAFQAEAKALDAYAESNPDAPALFKNFHRSIQETFAPHAAKLARELGDPKTPPAQVSADRRLLTSYYNNLVQATNSLLQAEAKGQLN